MDKRYLYYDVVSKPTKIWSGLKHQRHLLQGVLKEAYLLNRIAVLHPLCIASMHNFGKRQMRPIGDMIDLDASRILESGNAPKAPDWIDKNDLDFAAFKAGEIKVIGAEQNHFIDEESDLRYALIIRDTSTLLGDKWGNASNYVYKNIGLKKLPKQDYNVVLKTTAPIRKAAASIIDVLGDGLPPPPDQDFLPRCRTVDKQRQMPPGAYACLHLRLGDRLIYEDKWKFWVCPDKLLKMICRFLPVPNAPLYIMSNMEDTEYHDELKKHYRVFTARNFPELNRRLPPPGAITDDEHLLAREIEYKEYLPGGTDLQGRTLQTTRSPLATPGDPDNTFVYAVEELIYNSAYAHINTDFLNSFRFSLNNPYLADITKRKSGPTPRPQPLAEPPLPEPVPCDGKHYLIHEYAEAGGVLRNKQRLSTLLCEAVRLGRVAVITPWDLDARYNRGQAQQRSPADFVDLEQAQVYGTGPDKRGVAAQWVMETQLDPGINDRRIIAAEVPVDDDTTLIVRRFENREQEHRAAAHRYRAVLPAAKHIQTLAKDIQYQLGNNCLPATHNALETRTWIETKFSNGIYHCMHLPNIAPKASWLATHRHLPSQALVLRRYRHILGEIQTDDHREIRLYVIGDAALDKYRHTLGKFARVYSADDFESLQPFLKAGNNTCDLFTVFAVETIIMRDAKIKIHPSSAQLKQVAATDPDYYITHLGYLGKNILKKTFRFGKDTLKKALGALGLLKCAAIILRVFRRCVSLRRD